MAKAKNKVISGDYANSAVVGAFGVVAISQKKPIIIDKTTIESYELITDEHIKSAASGIARGLVGGAILGPVGLLAGLTAKTNGIYQVVILFKDGKRSLLEIDDKIYKLIVKNCF